jgi:hypothetical protein
MPPTSPKPWHLLRLVDRAAAPPLDFSDPESQRVLAEVARVVSRELGREAAREYFAELIGPEQTTR